jgi:hypothetical protein
MRKTLFFALLVSVISHQFGFADLFWIDDSPSWPTFNVVYTEEPPGYPTNAAEIYLGFFTYGDRLDLWDISFEPSPSVTLEQVSPLLDHDFTFRLDLGSTVPEDLCSIYIDEETFGIVVYELNVHGNWSTHGTYISGLESYLHVKTQGAYTVGPGQSVSLNANGYLIPCGSGYYWWTRDYDPLVDDYIGDYAQWWLGDFSQAGAEMIPSTVSYDYLTNQLGLSPGTYTISAYMEHVMTDGEYEILVPGYDKTTITIIPEPASLFLLALGGLLLRKRNV